MLSLFKGIQFCYINSLATWMRCIASGRCSRQPLACSRLLHVLSLNNLRKLFFKIKLLRSTRSIACPESILELILYAFLRRISHCRWAFFENVITPMLYMELKFFIIRFATLSWNNSTAVGISRLSRPKNIVSIVIQLHLPVLSNYCSADYLVDDINFWFSRCDFVLLDFFRFNADTCVSIILHYK